MCLVFLRGRTTLDFKCSFFVLLSLFRSCRRNSDFDLVMGAVGVVHSCPPYLGTHTQRARCRGVKCTADVTCDICKDWSVAQEEAFLKKRSYSGCRKSRSSGSALPTAPSTLPPSASASSEAGRPAPPSRPPTPPSEGRGHTGKLEGVPRIGSREVSSPPSHHSVGKKWGRGAARVLASGGASDLAASSLPGVGVVGSSCSQESFVLAAPSSVASSASAERGR